MPDWKDFAVMLCALLVIVGAGALASAAHSFTIVRGKVLEKGVATVDLGGGASYVTPTVSVLLESDDRVFRIEQGMVVQYAVSEGDAALVDIGSEVEMMVSSHNSLARVISVEGTSPT